MANRKTNDQIAFEATRQEGIDFLHMAGKLAATAGEAVKAANDKRASALDAAIMGLCTPGVMGLEFTFDVCDRAGNVVEHCTATLRDYLAGFRNADLSDNRAKQSAFRGTMLPLFFGVAGDQSAGAKATWALFTGKALPAAVALVDADMSVSINSEGKLTVDGGAGEDADNLRSAAAKSTSALVKAAKGEAGSNRETPQNDKSEGREATPSEVTRAAVAIAKLIAKGEVTACAATLSNLRELAKLVAGNPDAFAED